MGVKVMAVRRGATVPKITLSAQICVSPQAAKIRTYTSAVTRN